MKEQLLTAEQMRQCDDYTINSLGIPSRTLMERAADSVVKEILNAHLDFTSTLVVCGSGNNGGDGFAIARFLAEEARKIGIEAEIKTFFAGNEASISEECKRQRKLAKASMIPEIKKFPESGVTLIIDAIFGIGLTRQISGELKDIIDSMNNTDAAIISVDIPSGVNADTGEIMGAAVRAHLTVTFAAYKIGLFLFPGAEFSGKIIKADIGIGTESLMPSQKIFTALDSIPFTLPSRSPSSNKGTYGNVLVVGGAKNMAGAAFLSAKAAYRTGAGLVRIFTAEENRNIIQTLLPEAVLLTYENKKDIEKSLSNAVKSATAVVLGPGLSTSEEAKIQLETVIKYCICPLVLDADALNLLAKEENKHLWNEIKAPTVITPHMGEMSRLTGLSIENLKSTPLDVARDFALKKDVICCMKDARTAVSDGENIYLNSNGNSGMSKGGSGDVLTGIIAALIAEGMTLFNAACTGVFLHGRAGDIAANIMTKYSLLASDIIEHIPQAIWESEHLRDIRSGLKDHLLFPKILRH